MRLKLKKHWATGQITLGRVNRPFFEIMKNSTNSRWLSTTGFKRYKIYSKTKKLLWRKGEKEALTTTFQVVLGHKKHHHEEWVSVETLDRIQERKKKKETAIENSRTRTEQVNSKAEYRDAIKQMKGSVRSDKQKYVEDLSMTAEKVAREGNIKQLCDTTKNLLGKYSEPERSVKHESGKPVTETQELRNIRWRVLQGSL
ncbi:unnamed protein product [Schistosoma margrebowiei]|uniref:Uncharacterized protein n=1 Tax=Schistosoma margrebowiei TaxID=48269 RepID=A0A183M8S3_9TREM|nr:unnamed protein product [Schistosoma margrebowiei]